MYAEEEHMVHAISGHRKISEDLGAAAYTLGLAGGQHSQNDTEFSFICALLLSFEEMKKGTY